MEITVQTRHLDIGDQHRDSAVEKARHLERFLEGSQRAEILFSKDHAARDDGYVSCEVLVIARGRSVRARAKGHLSKDALEAGMSKEPRRRPRMQARLVHRPRPRRAEPSQPSYA